MRSRGDMMKILLRVCFNGRAYCGFQAQKNGLSVQQVLTDAATKLFGFPCSVTGCSRTDSGVHALGFCALLCPRDFREERWCSIPVGKLHRAINVLLPDDISVMACAEVADDFHPRYQAHSKMYEYRIYDAPVRDPFLMGRVYHTPRRISDNGLALMQQTAQLFLGQHDFSAFMATGSKITTPVRTVFFSEVIRESQNIIRFRVEADGFLYNMVRIMTGTLLECAYGKRSPEDVLRALHTGMRSCAGFTAPPEGLCLHTVKYQTEIHWLCE